MGRAGRDRRRKIVRTFQGVPEQLPGKQEQQQESLQKLVHSGGVPGSWGSEEAAGLEVPCLSLQFAAFRATRNPL